MKKRLMLGAILLALFGALSVGAEEPKGDAARGKTTFLRLRCDACHGTAGQGTRFGVRLAPGPLPMEAFAHAVHHPRAAMPRFPEQFVSGADIADIVAYLATMKPGPKADEIPLLKN